MNSTVEVREIGAGDTHQAAKVMLALRPRCGTPAALIDAIDTRLRPAGAALVAAAAAASAGRDRAALSR